jgi:ABC-2 type transport system permease protein
VTSAFPFLLSPHLAASRNRLRRRERGDGTRAGVFGGIGVAVCAALFMGARWLTLQLAFYDELGEYLLRLGLSWLFLTFLAFLAFSGVVTALSTFFLSEDLRLLLTAPIAQRRLFYARFVRTVCQASWMVIVFLMPVLLGVGVAHGAPIAFYLAMLGTVVPFTLIPVSVGTACTLVLVNVFPARRARDVLMLMGLLFACSVVVVLRVIRPEQLLRAESLPDVTGFFATLQSPVTPLLPSFWAGEALFASLRGAVDMVHLSALWTTAAAFCVFLRMADGRWHFAGYSRSQEAPKARFVRLTALDRVLRVLPFSAVQRQLLTKDAKTFLRDVSQWSQLLLLLALVLIYLYNFRVLDLQRIPYMSGFIKNVYAFVNMAMAGFVMATVAVRFVFPAVSAEGQAFWVIRTAPISLRDFLWSKFWTGLVPVLVLTEVLTMSANQLLGVDPFLKVVSACAIALLSVALVGVATGLGARYPRFTADNPSQVAGSYGGVAFMIVAVMLVILTLVLLGWPAMTYLVFQVRQVPLGLGRQVLMAASALAAVVICVGAWIAGMRSGVAALEAMSR